MIKQYRYTKGWKRKKRILIAYTLRGIVFLVFISILGLMVCGCIFVYQLFHPKQVVAGVIEKKLNYTQETAGGFYEENDQQDKVFREDEETKDLSGMVIVLDAGHGGKDTGTMNGNVYEKDINIQMIHKLESMLKNTGATLVKTRDDDTFLSLPERVDFTKQPEADLFVSIHCNYYEDDSQVCGLECYYDKSNKEGQAYAESIASEVKNSGIVQTRGAREGDYYVTRETTIPAVLIEIGYLSNREECSNLTNEEYLEQLASALTKGIIRQVREMK
ncbi:MAG: N-acetylmuramoyl-L-alanine amidase [Lachnospiraceae bacterium]|nr:N-acetylmuramoyl-L-alanine amidase [Lachnospiraceae bacterium]